jgi:hypothetical protein
LVSKAHSCVLQSKYLTDDRLQMTGLSRACQGLKVQSNWLDNEKHRSDAAAALRLPRVFHGRNHDTVGAERRPPSVQAIGADQVHDEIDRTHVLGYLLIRIDEPIDAEPMGKRSSSGAPDTDDMRARLARELHSQAPNTAARTQDQHSLFGREAPVHKERLPGSRSGKGQG